MGKKFAPAYANIYMAQWEETFPKCPKIPFCYLRFLDGVWGIWHHSHPDFQNFLKVLNSHHASIKVKSISSSQAIDFLDTTVYKGLGFPTTGRLDFKVFFKETDTHALLHHQSYHPHHTFQGIVLAQLLRFRRICSQEESFEEAKQVLFKALRTRGYSRSRLWAIFKEHCQSIMDPAAPSPQAEEVLVLAIFTFSSASVGLTKAIRNNFAQTLADTSGGGNVSILAACKRNTNLRDLLVHSRLPRAREQLKLARKPRVARAWSRHSSCQGVAYIPLNAANCIYMSRCSRCGRQYVGQTKNSIRTWLYQHRYVIRSKRPSDRSRGVLVEHFRRHGVECLQIQGLEHDPRWTLRQRLHKEQTWIKKLNTRVPHGLNERI